MGENHKMLCPDLAETPHFVFPGGRIDSIWALLLLFPNPALPPQALSPSHHRSVRLPQACEALPGRSRAVVIEKSRGQAQRKISAA
jgi:hypothetical protein